MIKIYYKLFWFALFLQTHSLVSQDSFTVYERLISQHEGEHLEKKVDSLILALKQEKEIASLAQIAHEFAVEKIREGDALKAIYYGQLEVSELKTAHLQDTTLTKALYNLGRFYTANGEYKKAISQFDEVIRLDNIPWRVAQSYAEIARCHRYMGEYYKSVSFFEKGFELFESQGNFRSLVIQSINLAWAYENIGSPEAMDLRQAVLERADSLRIRYNINPGPANYRGLLNAFALRYLTEEYYDFESANALYLRNLMSGIATEDSTVITMTYNNLANLYNKEKNDSTLFFITKGFQYLPSTSDSASLYDNLSDYYLIKGDTRASLSAIHKALQTSLGVEFDQSLAPSSFQLSNSDMKAYALFCLRKKAELTIRLFEQTNETSLLKQVVATVRSADQLIDMIQSDSFESDTKLFWRKEAASIYLPGTYAAYLLGNHESTLFFMEKNKALLLSQEVSRNTAYSKLPKDISAIERSLKKKVFELESQNNTPEASTELFDAKRAYEEYINSIKLLYPEYFRSLFGTNIESLAQIQSSLEADATLVSYIWNTLHDDKEVIVGVALNRNEVSSFEIPVTDSFKNLLNDYRQLNARPLQTKTDLSRFQQVSHHLYNTLFPSDSIHSILQNKKLMLLPDGDLQTIPFESLITDAQTQEYLLQKTDVSYLYSVSFSKRNDNVNRRASRRMIAYAPVTFDQTGLDPLKKTSDELSAIEAQIGGRLRLEGDATKNDFLSESSRYHIIHLATHANANEDPWIAFSDDKVKLNELYTYRNNADLVTLSACNTLLGEEARGEGVLSLSRGFFYSGAKSVVASLWNVDDQSTSTIMADFYANLKAGQGKSEALNNAKRNYLKTHSLTEQSPYYWSSFVLIGDDEPIDFSDNLYIYLIAILLVSLLAFIFVKKKQKT